MTNKRVAFVKCPSILIIRAHQKATVQDFMSLIDEFHIHLRGFSNTSRSQAIRLDFCAANTSVSVSGITKCCGSSSDKPFMVTNLVVDEDDYGEGYSWDPPLKCQRVHPESFVHARRVGEEGSQSRLKAETEIHHRIPHPLLEQRILPSLTDDEVSPLHHHDGDEEGGVAGVLQDLPVGVGPFLAV